MYQWKKIKPTYILKTYKVAFWVLINHQIDLTRQVLKKSSFLEPPLVHLCLNAPSGTFSLSWDGNFYQTPNVNRLFSFQKFQVLECNFFYSISNGDKIIGQFPSGVEILWCFFHRGRFFGQFFQWGWGPLGLWHRGLLVAWDYFTKMSQILWDLEKH